jgi:hypothetical protein
MKLFKSRNERVVRRAMIEPARKGPMRCLSCRAWLPSTAVRCDYCESVDPVRRDPDVTPAPSAREFPDEAAFGSEFDRFLRGIPGG